MQRRLKKINIHQKNILKPITKLGIKDNFLNLLKYIYKKSTTNIIINDNMFKTFSCRYKKKKKLHTQLVKQGNKNKYVIRIICTLMFIYIKQPKRI